MLFSCKTVSRYADSQFFLRSEQFFQKITSRYNITFYFQVRQYSKYKHIIPKFYTYLLSNSMVHMIFIIEGEGALVNEAGEELL